MERCFELARHGEGRVAPNPLVGCVIAVDGRIIGEGWHRQYGGPHAEVHAIASVADKSLLNRATLYVNLEPCAHYGKTPPCANLIVEMGIPHVVIANRDPFDEVNGKGIEYLESNGVHVELGIEEEGGRELNRHFFTFHELKRPYITLKWAQTLSGHLAPIPQEKKEGPAWISHPGTRKLVHQWRARHSAILVGWRTVEADNPELTVRDVEGKSPLRVVIDPHNRLSGSYRTFNGFADSIVFSENEPKVEGDFEWVPLGKGKLLDEVLQELVRRNVNAVLVEGGASTLLHFIERDLWDEARVITGKAHFERGVEAPALKMGAYSVTDYCGDRITYYRNR